MKFVLQMSRYPINIYLFNVNSRTLEKGVNYIQI